METKTTEDQLKAHCLGETRRIAAELLAQAKRSQYGLYWENPAAPAGSPESLYSGTSGIVLFLLELYKQTGEEEYLEAARGGKAHLLHYCQQQPAASYAFLTGRLGVAYLMLKWYDLTADPRDLEYAVQFTEGCEHYLNRPDTIDDLINGAAGMLLCLLHIHSYTSDQGVLEKIRQFTKHLIHKAQFGEKGLFWDGKSKSIQGLCGFSHGASGLGFVFGELGHYFNNPAFDWLAQQAYAYENHYFDQKAGNWADFRKGFYDQKGLETQLEAFRQNNRHYFTAPSYMSAWCHGAPGIGLSRLRATGLGHTAYQEDLDKALLHTKETTIDPSSKAYILCHGKGGNAMLFLQAYKATQKTEYLEWAQLIGRQILDYREQENKGYLNGYGEGNNHLPDYSLYMGTAGIGYFLLELSAPQQVPPVIYMPVHKRLENIPDEWLSEATEAELKGMLLSTGFPRTLHLILQKASYKKAFEEALQDSDLDADAILKDFVASTAAKGSALSELFALEEAKYDLYLRTNYPYLKIRTIEVSKQGLVNKDTEAFKTLCLRTNEQSTCKELQHYSNLSEPAKWGEASEQYMVLLHAQEGKVQEFEVPPLVSGLLDYFQSKHTVAECLETFKGYFDLATEQEEEQFVELIVNQLKEMLRSSFLLPAGIPALNER